MSATDYLSALLWGTPSSGVYSGEDTTTLGTDRVDRREPPSAYHWSALQTSRMRQLLALMSAHFKGGSRVRIYPVTSNPFSSGEMGTWIDSSASNALKYFNGTTNTTLGAGGGGGTLAASYAAGASQTDNTFALDATRLGIRIRDNATPIADNLLLVQNSAGSSTYLAVSANGVSSFKATSAAIDDWLSLSSATTASAGNQKWSPSITLTGNGWKTNATAASQSVAYKLTTVPIQGAAAPTGALRISESINGGGATTLLEIGSANITAYKPVVPGFTTDTIAPTQVTVSYSNSWVDFGAPYSASVYWKDAAGIVYLHIACKSGTASTAITTLPAGYRPGRQLFVIGGGDSGGTAGGFTVSTGGVVTPATAGNTGKFLVVSYPAEG